jgi:hypothetical protein
MSDNNFFAWPDITNFHNLRKAVKSLPEVYGDDVKIEYKTKIKLHGTNAAIHICGDGTILAQSRTAIISPQNDNCGFARWVMSQEDKWQNIKSNTSMDIIVFGEWVGPGVQKGVAVNSIPNKIFAVFAVILKNENDVAFICDPEGISSMLCKHDKSMPENVYILPWYEQDEQIFKSTIDWKASVEELQPELDRINQTIEMVEKCDPWVKSTFGVEGVGEGLVFYPGRSGKIDNFVNLAFKAKGEKHQAVAAKVAVQADATVTNNAKEFANLVLTESRLEQGTKAVGDSYESKFIGKFIEWIVKDVQKETKAELEASKLTWEQVGKVVSAQAKQWFLNKIKTTT